MQCFAMFVNFFFRFLASISSGFRLCREADAQYSNRPATLQGQPYQIAGAAACCFSHASARGAALNIEI